MAGDEERGLGTDVTPRKKGRFGTYVIIGVIALVVILGVTLFTGGDDEDGSANGASPGATVPTTIGELQAQITATNNRIATLEGTVAGIVGPTVTQEDIASLQTDIDTMSATLTRLNTIVDNLIENGTGSGNNSNETEYWGEISRWDFDSLRILGCTDDYTFEVVSKSPSRIEDEDLYEITVAITNENTIVATGEYNNTTQKNDILQADIDLATIALNHGLEIVISPRDYCMVDEELMYLDSDSYPYLSWDSEFVTRVREGQDVCRRITFTSEKYNFGSLLPGNSLELELVLELYYA